MDKLHKLANVLKEYRYKKGLTQKELSKKMGIPNGTIGHWENGKVKPSTQYLNKLCLFFNLDRNTLEPLVNDKPVPVQMSFVSNEYDELKYFLDTYYPEVLDSFSKYYDGIKRGLKMKK